MKRVITIKYNWEQTDGTDVKPHHVDYLEESATDRIYSQIAEGFTSGQLIDNLSTNHDPRDEDGTDYKGWWEVETKE